MKVHVPSFSGTRTLTRYAGTNKVQFRYAYPFGYVGTRTPLGKGVRTVPTTGLTDTDLGTR